MVLSFCVLQRAYTSRTVETVSVENCEDTVRCVDQLSVMCCLAFEYILIMNTTDAQQIKAVTSSRTVYTCRTLGCIV